MSPIIPMITTTSRRYDRLFHPRGVLLAPSCGARWPFRSAAGVGAGRRCTFLRLLELDRGERRAVEDVPLADLDSVDAEELDHLAHDQRTGDDHRRTIRVERTKPPPLRDRNGREPPEL